MISIHALRKESDHALHDTMHDLAISIHALRKESDARLVGVVKLQLISIHALRKESDTPRSVCSWCPLHFNPRSP